MTEPPPTLPPELFRPLEAAESWVVGQLGQSLDGRIATETGHSHYVTGAADLHRLHRLRALCDAVLVGAGTVAADNPRLTVRLVEGPNPVRVILDPRGRLDAGHRVFREPDAPTLWVRAAGMSEASPAGDAKLPPHVERLHLPGGAGAGAGPGSAALPLSPAMILHRLRERGLRRILVEGGGRTVSSFLERGLLDRLHVTVAPLVIGSGRHGITLPPVATMEQALRPRCRVFQLGDDVLFDLAFGEDRREATLPTLEEIPCES